MMVRLGRRPLCGGGGALLLLLAVVALSRSGRTNVVVAAWQQQQQARRAMRLRFFSADSSSPLLRRCFSSDACRVGKHKIDVIEGESYDQPPLWTFRGFPCRAEWDVIVDVRSPSEFAEDAVPGAVNLPVLNDTERAAVGLLYASDRFEAKVKGGQLIARNLAQVVRGVAARTPRDGRVLVYCWRGGDRSLSAAYFLAKIGWHVARLQGGYKLGYRKKVRNALYETDSPLLRSLSFHRIEGPTGSGKGALLEALRNEASLGVLDLESLANHRGSALGDVLVQEEQAAAVRESDDDDKSDDDHHHHDDDDVVAIAPQPSQKRFESLVHEALRRVLLSSSDDDFDDFDDDDKTLVAAAPPRPALRGEEDSEEDASPLRRRPTRVVVVEAESAKIGRLQVPSAICEKLAKPEAGVTRLEVPIEARVARIREMYSLFESPQGSRLLAQKLVSRLRAPRRWLDMIQAEDWDLLVRTLLLEHYDPAYARATQRDFCNNSSGLSSSTPLVLADLCPSTMERAARVLAARLLNMI